MGTSLLEYIFILANVIAILTIIAYLILGPKIFRLWTSDVDKAKGDKDITKGVKNIAQGVKNITKGDKNIAEGFTEEFNIFGMNIPDPPSPNEIKDKMDSAFNELGNKMNSGFNQIGNEIKGVANQAKDAMMGPLMDIFDKVKATFEQIPKRFNAFGNGFKHIFEGIGQEFVGFGEGLHDSFDDIGKLMKYSGFFLFDYIKCGVQMIQNLHACIFYYSLQIAGQIMYLPIRWTLWLAYMVGLDMYSYEESFWNNVEWFDGVIFNTMKFHIAHFPKNVREQCYNCRRIKQSTVSRVANDINNDFLTGIPYKLKRGINTIRDGGDELASAFRPGYI